MNLFWIVMKDDNKYYVIRKINNVQKYLIIRVSFPETTQKENDINNLQMRIKKT